MDVEISQLQRIYTYPDVNECIFSQYLCYINLAF
jgi:hypothetical protein